jgi:hypothetical protein
MEEPEDAPDRAEGTVVPRGVIDGDARRMIDQLKKLPLPSELVLSRHASPVWHVHNFSQFRYLGTP